MLDSQKVARLAERFERHLDQSCPDHPENKTLARLLTELVILLGSAQTDPVKLGDVEGWMTNRLDLLAQNNEEDNLSIRVYGDDRLPVENERIKQRLDAIGLSYTYTEDVEWGPATGPVVFIGEQALVRLDAIYARINALALKSVDQAYANLGSESELTQAEAKERLDCRRSIQ